MKRTVLFLFLSFLGLSACADRSVVEVVPEALTIGTPQTVFAATTRALTPEGTFGGDRSVEHSLVEMTISVPPNRKPGGLDEAYGNPNPSTQFVLANQKTFQSPQAFETRVRDVTRATDTSGREAMIYVHGFNTTHTESAFRAAQLAHDLELPGAHLIYSWPSRGSPLAYAYDGESALIARDGLENLLRRVEASGVDNIVLVAHSMGSVLVMETLRQIEIANPGWSQRSLGGIILFSPDLDIDLFRAQLNRIPNPPEPFVVFVSNKDKILGLSQRLRGTHSRERLGNIESAETVADLPIEIVDTSDFSSEAESSHFVAASSPTLVKVLNNASEVAEALGEDRSAVQNLLPGVVVKYDEATEIELLSPPDTSG
ncbi:MAG: alpha/beta fold hydrolase [Rhodobacteraceae bacterium]|nr:alpha/beta fold hydrolase [Paracoccaceae bacterium]